MEDSLNQYNRVAVGDFISACKKHMQGEIDRVLQPYEPIKENQLSAGEVAFLIGKKQEKIRELYEMLGYVARNKTTGPLTRGLMSTLLMAQKYRYTWVKTGPDIEYTTNTE